MLESLFNDRLQLGLQFDDADFQTADALFQTANPGEALVHALRLYASQSAKTQHPAVKPPPQKKTAEK